MEKRNIFLNDRDRLRFVYSLTLFNDSSSATNIGYFFDIKSIEIRLQYPRKKLVRVLAFALMSNHYHLLLEQIAGNGITEFMRKVGAGYTNYFNKKYQRVGPLFQGKPHFIYLPYYIHLNPLEAIEPEWKINGIKNPEKALDFLASYRWSSHQDYLGKMNFPELLDMGLLDESFGGPKQYQANITEWLRSENYKEMDKEVIIE